MAITSLEEMPIVLRVAIDEVQRGEDIHPIGVIFERI